MLQRNDATQALLKEGLRSYYDAIVAVREFRLMVLGECKTVLEKHIPQLEKALGSGIKLDPKRIRFAADPYGPNEWSSDIKWTRNAAWLEAQLDPKDPGNRLTSVDVGIWWEKTTGGTTDVWAYSDMYFPTKQLVQALHGKIKPPLREEIEDEGEGYLVSAEEVPETDLGSFSRKLEEALLKWIKAWKQVGGIESALPRR